MREKIKVIFNNWLKKKDNADFSGVLSATNAEGFIYQQSYGYRYSAEQLPNEINTAFAIASGTKLFTGLAVCKLIDEKKLSLDDTLANVLSCNLGKIDSNVTIKQLLTHTSGVGDYIDEDAEDVDQLLEDLYATYPSYLWENMDYYLQMSNNLAPKFAPGERFAYSNTGFVLLGLVVEAVSGTSFQSFVTEQIINPCGLERTGFYRMDELPANTALGYMFDDGKWRTNIFSVPVIGGSDGGMFSSACDLDKLWRAIFANKILTAAMTEQFLTGYVNVEDDETFETYGLGVYRIEEDDKLVYFAIGFDAGVGFLSCYFPRTKTVVSAFRNFADADNYDLIWGLLKVLG